MSDALAVVNSDSSPQMTMNRLFLAGIFFSIFNTDRVRHDFISDVLLWQYAFVFEFFVYDNLSCVFLMCRLLFDIIVFF